jgi:beta-lactamase class A
MNYKSLLAPVIALLIGVVIGHFSRDAFHMVKKDRGKACYVERHEGESNYINPLLGCDVAEEVLTDPEIGNIKSKVEPIVKSAMEKRLATNVGVYFRELNDGYWFSIGETEKFVPASLRKVPLMIALLKQAERENGLLDRVVKVDLSNDYTLAQNVKPSQSLEFGKSYTVRDLMFRMIVYSDNNAFTCLTRIVDRNEYANVFSKLRMQNPLASKDDEFLSVQTYASFFRVLYNASYLSREASDAALGILAKSEFKAGLVAGVLPGVEVSHKFGEQSDAREGTIQLHDCGIVYYPKHPYLLCVMSKGTNFEPLDNIIKDISAAIFSEVDAQSRTH